MSETISYRLQQKPISHFMKLYKRHLLNLNPGFQRKSVWGIRDREKLIGTIFDGYPVPSVFLYRREDEYGRIIFDVLDGKQRMEAIFAFCGLPGFGRQRFGIKYRFPHEKFSSRKRWRNVKEHGHQQDLLGYMMQVVEVAGEIPDIQDLFVRINSTGKKLSNQERRRAQFISSPILAEAERLARKLAKHLSDDRIISDTQRQRMKDVELLCELIISFYQESPINKKAAVDAAMSGTTTNLHTVRKAAREVIREYKTARWLLRDIQETRFRNITEFYSLMTALHYLRSLNLNLSGNHARGIAERLLRRLSLDANQAQEDRHGLRSIQIKPVVRDYLMAVQQGADALGQRVKRQDILMSLLRNVFEEKDQRRSFTRQQRELIWSSSVHRKCPICGKPLTWRSFHVDHILPWSRGGKTDLTNAKVLCGPCNQRKGNR